MAELYFQLSGWIRSANRETKHTARAAMIRARVRCYCRTQKIYHVVEREEEISRGKQRMHEPVCRRRMRFPFIFIAFANCKMFVLFHIKFNCALYMVYTPSSTQRHLYNVAWQREPPRITCGHLHTVVTCLHSCNVFCSIFNRAERNCFATEKNGFYVFATGSFTLDTLEPYRRISIVFDDEILYFRSNSKWRYIYLFGAK